jgi:hypothetical protein
LIKRRTHDNKRKLDERNSVIEAEALVKKHERHEIEDLAIPPPPVDVPIPEPMETLENQIYERPWDRRKAEEINSIMDADRTPKVRRKQKSSGDIVCSRQPVITTEHVVDDKISHDSNMKPKAIVGSENDARIDKPTVCKPQEQILPFERPEPMASPRPPRMTPPQQPTIESRFTDTKVQVVDNRDNKVSDAKDLIPPPLPEKKSKSGNNTKPQDSNKCKQIDNKSDFSEIGNLVSTEVPFKDTQSSDIKVTAEVHSQLKENVDKNDKENESCLQNLLSNSVNNIAVKNSSSKNISIGSPIAEKIMPHCDYVSAKSADSHTVISPNDISLAGNCYADNHASNEIPTASISTELTDAENLPVDLVILNAPKSSTSAEYLPEKISTVSSNLMSVNHTASSCEFLNSDECIKNQDDASVRYKEEISDNISTVKPLPSVALINIEKGEETKSVKPPWVKPKQKELDVIENTKSKEMLQPSINNLPKLVVNKANEVEEIPKAIIKDKSLQPGQSINNLPKLKIESKPEFTSIGISVDGQEKVETSSPVIDLPLVVPFPGKAKETGTVISAASQLVKQDSPKSLFNNIPKPFKTDLEKDVKPTTLAPTNNLEEDCNNFFKPS